MKFKYDTFFFTGSTTSFIAIASIINYKLSTPKKKKKKKKTKII